VKIGKGRPCGHTSEGNPDVKAKPEEQITLVCGRKKGLHVRHQDMLHNVTFQKGLPKKIK
jgi:hypothetical protein